MQLTANDDPDDSTASMEAPGAPAQTQATDPELLFEQRFGKVMADNDKLSKDKADLGKELSDLHDRLARLQENNVSGASPTPSVVMLNSVRTSYKND